MFHDGLKRRVCQTSFNVVDLLVDISLSLSHLWQCFNIYLVIPQHHEKLWQDKQKTKKTKAPPLKNSVQFFFLHFLEGIEKLISKRCQLLSFTMKGLFLL